MATLEQLTPQEAVANLRTAGFNKQADAVERNFKKSGAITSADLTPQPNFKTTPPPAATAGAGLTGAIEATQDDFTKQLEQKAKEAETMKDIAQKEYLKSILGTEGEVESTAKEYSKKGGVDDIQTELNDINQQIRVEQNALQREIERIQTAPGSTKGQIDLEVAERQRVSLRKQADLSIIQQGIQGRYSAAKAIADRAVAVKMEQQKIKNEALRIQYEENKELFNKAEQRQFESLLADRERKFAKEEADEKMKYEIALTAQQNGAPIGVVQAVLNSPSKEQALTNVGSYLRDPLDDQLKRLSIQSSQLSIQEKQTALKEYKDTQEVLNDPEFGGIIKDAANLVGAERGKTTKTAMAEAIRDQNYQRAFGIVANNVEEALSGENATRFGSARTDYELLGNLRGAIQDFADAGGNTGLLTGKAEDISRKLLGVTGDPKLTALAVQLDREFQTYRTQATGAAFTPEESREYAKVNPRSTASLDLNLATIDGARNQLSNRIVSTVNTRVNGADKLWQASTGDTGSSYVDNVDRVLQEASDPLSSFLSNIERDLNLTK
jgi:hypothetical protein